MTTRTSGRAHRVVNYDEKHGVASGQPAWANELGDGAAEAQQHKENKPAAGKQQAHTSAPAAVAVKGRNAGLTRLPIEDAKPGGSKPNSGKARTHLAPAAAGKQVLPGVVVRAVPAGAPAAQAKPAAKVASKGSGSSGWEESPDAGGKAASGGGKRRAAAAAAPEAAPARPQAKAAAASGPAAAAAPAAKRSKAAAVAAPHQEQPSCSEQLAAAPAPAPALGQLVAAAATAAAADDPQLPGSGAEALLEQYAANFRELQAEYFKLQGLYEDLKAAKIDEEVAQLLEQQNKYVGEHGQQAAALAEQYKAEAEQHAAALAELGGGALAEQCAALQADLMNCQQALLDKEAESVEKSKRIAELQSRVSFLDRFARVYESRDKCLQTDPTPNAAASAQFPSLESSGVEMLQAHALVPEGAGGGSLYKRPRTGAPPAAEPSYTELDPTPLPAAADAAAACAPEAVAAAPGAAVAPAGAPPVSASDMDLTGPEQAQAASSQHPHGRQQAAGPAQRPQQAPGNRRLSLQPQPAGRQPLAAQPQQQRRHSLQPSAGRVAHAAAAGLAPRPASAESQVQPVPAAPAAGRQQQWPAPAAVGGKAGVAPPTDRQLLFSSLSTGAGDGQPQGPQPLAVVPEEEQAAGEEPAQQQPAAAVPAASHTAAALAAAGAAAPTPGTAPPPPRELALAALTGLVATPMRGGFYRFTDHRHGFVFELGPAPAEPDSAELPGDEGDAEICYRPISFGTAAQLLPGYLKEEAISFRESQRWNFISQLLDCLASK